MMLRVSVRPNVRSDERAECLIVNTHLIFPHQPHFSVIRMRELRKILGFLELYLRSQHSPMSAACAILLCGDFNGCPTGAHYQILRLRNFTSSCEDNTTEITHRNHLGELLCCDFIFLQNPADRLGPLEDNLLDIVFRSTRQRVRTLQRAGSSGCFHAEAAAISASSGTASSAPVEWTLTNASVYRNALMVRNSQNKM